MHGLRYTARAVKKLLTALVLLAASYAQAPGLRPPVDLKDEPYHHLLFQNETFRVWKLDLPGRSFTKEHAHRYDYLAVALRDADISYSIASPRLSVGDAMASRNLARGETWYFHGGYAHLVRNNSGLDPVQEVLVEVMQLRYSGNELKDRIDDYFDAQQISPPVDPEATYRQEAYFYSTSIVRHRINAGESSEWRHDGGYLVVALTGLRLTAAGSRTKTELRMNAGEVKWAVEGVNQRLRNDSREAAEFVTVEVR